MELNPRPRTPLQDPRAAFGPHHPQIASDILRMISLYLRSVGLHASAAGVADEAQLKEQEAARRKAVLQLQEEVCEWGCGCACFTCVYMCVRDACTCVRTERICLILQLFNPN